MGGEQNKQNLSYFGHHMLQFLEINIKNIDVATVNFILNKNDSGQHDK